MTRRPKNLDRVSLLALLIIFAVAPTSAQNIQGAIAGTVTDKSGAILANIQLVLINRNTGQTFRTTTNGGGRYSFSQIPVGIYDLVASLPGFAVQRINGIN